VERKRLFGLPPFADSRAAGLDIYTHEAGTRTYGHLLDQAERALRAGYPVIVDAAFLRRAERDQAHALATRLGASFGIAACEAGRAVLRERLRTRTGDASEADVRVLEAASAWLEPLGPDELASAQQPPAPA
jgi:hypothetical protein